MQRVFVLMPFDDEFDNIYDFLISDPFSEAGYDVQRADEIIHQENILASIIDSIVNSHLIVADLSTSNPNVYYELGLAHACGKNVILITQEITEVPFDLRSYRIITYDTSNFTRMNKARQDIEKLIEDVQSGKAKFGSPITDFGKLDGILTTSDKQDTSIDSHDEDDRGFIDYQIDFEHNINVINEIVGGIGERLNNVTVKLEMTTNKLTNTESPKEKRNALRSLASDMNDYALWLQESNDKYRQALVNIGENLDAMLKIEFVNVEDRESMENLTKFANTIEDVENTIQEAQETFSGIVQTTDAIPKVEKKFNQAKSFMSRETKIFVDNIEQTLSVLVRARNAAMRILGGR